MIKSKKVFLGMIALLVLTIGGIGGGIYVYDQQLTEQTKEISQLMADREVLEQQIKIYRDANQKIQELSYIDEIAKEVLPPNKEQAEVIAEINKFARESGMTVSSLEFGGAQGNTPDSLDTSQTEVIAGLGVRVLPVTVSIDPSPSYDQVISFLQRIEINRRKMQVVSLDLTPQASDRSTFSSVIVTINIYLKG